MKKRIAIFLTTALTLAGAVTAFADNKTTELKVKVDSDYNLSIPANTTVAYGAEETAIGAVSVTGNIRSTEKVAVTVRTEDFVDDTDSTNTFAFRLLSGGKEFAGAEWSSGQVFAETPTEYALTVNVPEATWKTVKAGDYTGRIVFTADLQDAE